MILMLSTFGNNIIYEETYQEAVRSNKVKNVKYIQENSPTPDEFLRDAKNPDDIIKRGIVGNVARNKVIVERGLEYVSLGRKVMVCVSETDHCEVLKKRFEKQGLTVFDYFSKQDKDFKKDIERLTEDTKGKAGFIVLATVALGIGADTKAIDTVILADVRKASNGLFQRGGRGTRKVDFEAEETLIIHDFDDWFNETTWKWSKIRKKLINEYYFGEGSFTLKVAKKHKIEMRTND